MSRDELYLRVMKSASPHRAELDRLLSLRERKCITRADYEADRAKVLRAFEQVAVR